MTVVNGEDPAFLGYFSRDIIPGTVTILGCPLDLTATFRNGVQGAPSAIREASDSIESYSPFLEKDILDEPFSDVGDIKAEADSLTDNLELIRRFVHNIVSAGCKPLCLGGEHTISFPIIREILRKFPDLIVLHADAHADLRDEYEGNTINHATVIRRIADLTGPHRLVQMGIRSGTKQEFQWMKDHQTFVRWSPENEPILRKKFSGNPVYLTFDVDVLDPACLPGTGNPEPGGWFYSDIERLFGFLSNFNLVGADVVELNPGLDSSGVSAVTGAKIVRELIILLSGR